MMDIPDLLLRMLMIIIRRTVVEYLWLFSPIGLLLYCLMAHLFHKNYISLWRHDTLSYSRYLIKKKTSIVGNFWCNQSISFQRKFGAMDAMLLFKKCNFHRLIQECIHLSRYQPRWEAHYRALNLRWDRFCHAVYRNGLAFFPVDSIRIKLVIVTTRQSIQVKRELLPNPSGLNEAYQNLKKILFFVWNSRSTLLPFLVRLLRNPRQTGRSWIWSA